VITDDGPKDFVESAAHRALALLAQHRLITSLQMRTMLGLKGGRRRTSQILTQLYDEGLARYTVLEHQNRMRAWFLTLLGAKAVTGWPELRERSVRPVSNATEASLRAPHTLTVLRTHLAFLADAQAHGHEHSPLDWLPEVAHRLPDTGGEDRLIADALAFYSVPADGDRPRRNYRAFVEVDRATMSSERLARKLISYARFHSYRPLPPGRRGSIADQAAALAWQRFYPRFPRVLFVLTNASPSGLAQRITDLRAMASGHPLVTAMATDPDICLGVAVLEELEDAGASGEVWTPLTGSKKRRAWTDL
jgi:Replication-relaxation